MVSLLDIVSIYLCTCTSIPLQHPRQGCEENTAKPFRDFQALQSEAFILLKKRKKSNKRKNNKNPQSLQLGTTSENYMAINNDLQGGTACAHRYKEQGKQVWKSSHIEQKLPQCSAECPQTKKKYSSISKHRIS